MSSITRFEITGLHGRKNLDLRLKDNTMILVGENGAGKTTVLHILYYLLSGQWASVARYRFDAVAITIGNRRHELAYADFQKSFEQLDKRFLRRLPPPIRHRILALMEEKEGRLVTPELETICRQYDLPLPYLLHDLEMFEHSSHKSDPLRTTLEAIAGALDVQLLYLPTYRRIEQELNLIFKGLDERELRNRREMLTTRRGGNAYVELIEFGMNDVDAALQKTLTQLNGFARESLNNLTFGYLGDIVEQRYSSVDWKSIKDASNQTISNILDRIQEHILSTANKSHLRTIIEGAKTDAEQSEHTQVICHYFTKLMAFQRELESKEAPMAKFCDVCNEYMVDKQFRYNSSDFSFKIQPKGNDAPTPDIKLHHLSSGEKQIVSLFSHLYLSGGTNYFVLIDEPELSLSVPWQRRFLVDIRNAGFCAGLIAATHSPFIYDNELRPYAHGLGEFIV